jgi:uncharacterized protein YbjQ (UPF0145 family)
MLKKLFFASFENFFTSNKNCFLGSNIPGKTITRSLGLTSMVTTGVGENIGKELEKLINDFVKKAEEMGGNAIINFRFETGSYQPLNSGWGTSYFIIYGEVVVVE